MKKMLIVGNGFDIAHGLNTTYKNYIESDSFPSHLDKDNIEYWSDYENNISEKIEDIYERFLMTGRLEELDIGEKIANFEHEEYGLIESMVDQKYVTQQAYEEYISMNPDIEKEVRQLMNEINDFTIGLDNYLKKLSLEGIEEKYPLNEYELIISFNYTNLIENVYECKDIEHIHGLLNQKMIIGFNGYLNRTIEEDRNPKEEEFKYDGGDPSEFLIEKHTYSRSSEHYWQIEMEDLIHENLVKEIKKLSDENDKSLFEKRNEIEKIVENKLEENQYQIDIIGHSLGDPDKDFFDLLNDKIKYNGGIIQCYFHSQISKKELEDKIKKIIGNFN